MEHRFSSHSSIENRTKELGFPWECILVVLMGIERGMIYSSPVTCEKGEWSIVQGKLSFFLGQRLKIDEFSRAKMDATAKQLIVEKTLAYLCIG
uniref:Uncharacterized protein n=1 Tax=Cucumis melo TaxID=3656 RepID=A0A9I9ELZ1_CUCME